MSQAAKRPRVNGLRKLLAVLADFGYALPALGAVISVAISVLLVVADLIEPAGVVVASAVIVTGLLLRYRANHLLRDRRYAKMRVRLERERRFTRFWVGAGASMIAAVLLLPPFPAMLASSFLSLVLLLAGVATARRSAEIEQRLDLAKANAADECDRVRGIAETAASIPLIRSPEYITRLAHYEVTPGEIGILPFLALAVVAIAFFVYVGFATAAGLSEIARKTSSPEKVNDQAGDSGRVDKIEEAEAGSEPAPTYADECPAIGDPLEIDHGLGRLFKSAGAFKAGCGTKAQRVKGTGTWVSAGICEGANRSVAVSAPGERLALTYGEAAEFAWVEAMAGNLLAAETAESEGDEVNLIETRTGTYAFTRLDSDEGDEDPHSCADVNGTDRPFVEMSPQMTLLWLQLIEFRAEWAWPSKEEETQTEAFTFIAFGTSEVSARGSCDQGEACQLSVDGAVWRGSGTSYVQMDNLQPYMP